MIKEQFNQAVGNRLKTLRNKRGYTINEAAKCIGVAKSTYIEWEQGRAGMSFYKAILVAHFYNVLLQDLYSEDNKPWSQEEIDEIKDMFKRGWPSNYIKKMIMQKYGRNKLGVEQQVIKIMKGMYDHPYKKIMDKERERPNLTTH